MTVLKPRGFERWLSDYGPVVSDETSEEPIGWGFEIDEEMSEERFASLKQVFHVEWPISVVVIWLGYRGAVKKYGPAGPIERGKRGAFKSITFGKTKFSHESISPEWQKRVDDMTEKEEERRAYG